MKGGVKQGVANAVKICGNLTWVRASHSFDQYHSEEIENNKNLKKSIHESTFELWNFCKKKLQSGEYEQMILDEIFLRQFCWQYLFLQHQDYLWNKYGLNYLPLFRFFLHEV